MDDARAEVLAAADARARALAERDEPALLDLLHEDFGWQSHTGERLDRAQYLTNNLTRLRWTGQRLDDVEVAVVGDTAVVRCVVTDTVDAGGGPQEFRMPMTQTWVRQDGRWRQLAGHAGPRM